MQPFHLFFIGYFRPSSKRLSEALQTGIANACGEVKNFELVTTPELFYLVQAFNKLGPCKESSAEGYNSKLIKSFSRFHGEVRCFNGFIILKVVFKIHGSRARDFSNV